MGVRVKTILTLKEAACWLQCSPSHLYRDRVPCFRVGRKRRYDVNQLMKWMENRTVGRMGRGAAD